MAIEVHDLRMRYRAGKGTVLALDGLDLSVPSGGVFGFLGANGAGKTTTIRALVGHLRGVSGSMQMLGVDVPARLNDVIDRVGALVESPSFFPSFSGRRNLELLARSRGFPLDRVATALDTVGLTDRARSRFATYSLGMKQRLGVAAALLKDPELLILDEPANGLDPAGILEMRNLVRRLGQEGRTVFVSSHLLSEVQQTCDRVAVLDHGKCVATGTVQDIMRGGRSTFGVRVPGDARAAHAAANVLQQAGFPATLDADGRMVVEVESADAARVTEVLAGASIYLAELTPIERTLEDAFLELTRRATSTPPPPPPPAAAPEPRS